MLLSGKTPWDECGHAWNSDCCSNDYENGTLIVPMKCTERSPVFPEQEYWYKRVLKLSEGIEHTGGLRWELVGCLAGMWLLCYCCIFKGAKSTGKAAYVTSSFPLVMLIILLVRGVTLEGASEGIRYFLIPDFSKLANAEVWTQAGSQVFFSYVCGQGVLTSLGSFNKYSYNVLKWSSILSFFNFR